MAVKLLAGVTHAILSVPTREDSDKSGVRAVVDLCYDGPGDDTAICQIQLIKSTDGTNRWQVPHVPIINCGRLTYMPVFRGQLMLKLCEAAARAADRVKQDVGIPAYGKRYRIFTTEDKQVKAIEEVSTES